MDFAPNNMVWEGIQLVDIGTNNVREDDLNPGWEYAMVIVDNLQNKCTRVVIEGRSV